MDMRVRAGQPCHTEPVSIVSPAITSVCSSKILLGPILAPERRREFDLRTQPLPTFSGFKLTELEKH